MSNFVKRAFSTTARQFASVSAQAEHAGGMDLWRKLALFGAVPTVAILTIVIFTDHAKHKHAKKPEYVEYDYLRKRDKRYPWGDGTRTLFHNPKSNWHPVDWNN